MRHVNFCQLMDVYKEQNEKEGLLQYPNLSPGEQIRNAEQDFYHYLNSVFFCQSGSYYAVWDVNNQYLSALRIEPYSNGLLLCALETIPEKRKKGYAISLLSALNNHLAQKGSGLLYSHIAKKNTASLNLHRKCGFEIIKDFAILSDGSVTHDYYTLLCQY